MKNSNEWHTLAEASRILGKNDRYVSNWIKRHDDFPKPMLMDISGKKIIHDKGIQWISEHDELSNQAQLFAEENFTWTFPSQDLAWTVI